MARQPLAPQARCGTVALPSPLAPELQAVIALAADVALAGRSRGRMSSVTLASSGSACAPSVSQQRVPIGPAKGADSAFPTDASGEAAVEVSSLAPPRGGCH
jgi:hypothetical protein